MDTVVEEKGEGREERIGEMGSFFHQSPHMLSIIGPGDCFDPVNLAFEQGAGYLSGELCQAPVRNFIHSEDSHLPIPPSEKREPSPLLEARFRTKDGSYRWLRWIFLPWREDHWLALVNDITDEKEGMEELCKAGEVAEEAVRARDRFVALLSHDLFSPLNTLVGFLRLARRHVVKPVCPARTEEIMERAIQSGESLISLVRDLLSSSLLKEGKVRPAPLFHDARLLAWKSLEPLRPLARKKGVKLVNRIPEKSRLYADEALFSEVLKNLVTNSIKFCRSGDEITLFLPEGNPGTVAVADTGVGITAERTGDIFRYGLSTSTPGTAGERGNGLGLPLCRDIMEAHGGSLTVISDPGKKTAFYASLPPVKPIVLIVSPAPFSRELIRLCLQNLNVETVEEEGRGEALERVSRMPPHLIVADCFGREEGFSLLEMIKQGTVKNIPLIAVTEGEGMKIKDRIFLLGAEDLVSRPITMEDLNPRVRRFVG